MNRTAAVLLAAVLVVLAGCTGAVPGTADDGASANGDGNAQSAASDADTENTGTVSFYLSDEPNDIDDFEHLNVTITKVEFHRATADGNASADASASANGSADGEGDGDAEESGDGDTGDGNGEWIEYDVDDETVDLTELQGQNASEVADFNVPNGTYTQVRLTVSDVNGTLENGESTTVKLPSDRLKITERFTIGDGEEVDFVFDITVHQAGKSGKYILKPVVSESGTDVPIQTVDNDDDGDGLRAHFVGQTAAGGAVTVKVIGDRGPVAGATVTVNGEQAGTTDADGTVSFDVPADAEEIEVEVEKGDREAELTAKFGVGGDAEADEASDDEDADDEDADDEDADDGDADDEDADDGDAEEDDAANDGDDGAGESSLDASVVGSGSASESVILEVTRDGEVVEGADVVVDGEVVAQTGADGRATITRPTDGEEIRVEMQGESVEMTDELSVDA